MDTSLLRCVNCREAVTEQARHQLRCRGCGRTYAVRDGTVRMLPTNMREGDDERAAADVKRRTAESFAYEWKQFGSLRPEWRKNFLDYMQPHGPEFFSGLSLLDVGTGSGRHSREANALGARVVSVDLGDSIDVARRNLPASVMTIQADAERLPFRPESFDFVMSVGVLHHLPDPERALGRLVEFVKPGGRLHVYLYWQPPQRWHRLVLRGVSLMRRATTRMPHRVLHALCYPLAAALWVGWVLPYRLARSRPWLQRFAEAFPLKTYADYPFSVLVSDQFDRLSAPIEHRFTREQVIEMLEGAGLQNPIVLPNHGWVADAVRPAAL